MQAETNMGARSREEALNSFLYNISRAKQTALVDDYLDNKRKESLEQLAEETKNFIASPRRWLRPLALGMTGLATAFAGTHIINHLDIHNNRTQTTDTIPQVSANDSGLVKTSLRDTELTDQSQVKLATHYDGLYPNGKDIPPNFELIGVNALRERGWNGKNSTVYILDTGLDPGIAEIYGIEEGCYDAINDQEDACSDDFGKSTGIWHGSGVAAQIKSIAPDTEVKAVRMINGEGDSSKEWLSRAIEFVVEDAVNTQGPVIINMSFASSEFTEDDFEPLDNPQFIIVTALGNKGSRGAELPATLDFTALDVGSINVDCTSEGEVVVERRGSSAIDEEIEGMAPGGGNCTFIPTPNGGPLRDQDGNILVITGTSRAAPHVAGLVAAFAGAGHQAAHTVTRENVREFFSNMLGVQLEPGEEYDVDRLTRSGYYTRRDVEGTPNKATGFGRFDAKTAIDEWLRFLDHGGNLTEISFVMLPRVLIGGKTGRAGTDGELLSARVKLENEEATNTVPKLFNPGETVSLRWVQGLSSLNFEIDRHRDSFEKQSVNLGSQPFKARVVIDPIPLEEVKPTPTPPTR